MPFRTMGETCATYMLKDALRLRTAKLAIYGTSSGSESDLTQRCAWKCFCNKARTNVSIDFEGLLVSRCLRSVGIDSTLDINTCN